MQTNYGDNTDDFVKLATEYNKAMRRLAAVLCSDYADGVTHRANILNRMQFDKNRTSYKDVFELARRTQGRIMLELVEADPNYRIHLPENVAQQWRLAAARLLEDPT